MNEFVKLLVWQMAQVLGYENQTDLAEHSVLLLVDYDADVCHPIFIGKHFVSADLDPGMPWKGAVKYLTSDVISDEYKQECALFFSEKAARRKYEKQRVYDSINYVSQLSDGKRWTHCMQSLFTSSRSIQELSSAFTAEASFLHSPDIHFPPFDPASSESAGIFAPEGSPDNREHLLSYFLVIEVDAIRKSMESLRYLARHDQLTGLYNRHMMAEIVNDDPSIVIILDIDNFKGINDTYGHTAGDEALCTMSSRLEAVFWHHDRDLVFRLGGDEFLVVMKNASEEEAVSCLRLICEPVVFTTSAGQVISFSVSAGYIPCSGDFKASMKAADDALYAAKKAGKSGFVRAE